MTLEERLHKAEQALEALESQRAGLTDQRQALEDQAAFLDGLIKSLRYQAEYKKSNEAFKKADAARADLSSNQVNTTEVKAQLQRVAGAIADQARVITGIKNDILIRDRLLAKRKMLELRLKYHQLMVKAEAMRQECDQAIAAFDKLNISVVLLRIAPDQTLLPPMSGTHEDTVIWAQSHLKITAAQLSELEDQRQSDKA